MDAVGEVRMDVFKGSLCLYHDKVYLYLHKRYSFPTGNTGIKG